MNPEIKKLQKELAESKRRKKAAVMLLKHIQENKQIQKNLKQQIRDAAFAAIMPTLESLGRELNRPLLNEEPLDPRDFVFGDWECADSPTGQCIYDIEGYNSFDECIFCGDPEERK